MSEMPPRIWASVGGSRTSHPSGQTQRIGGWDEFPQERRSVEYRRADLPPTLAQALKVPEVARVIGALAELETVASKVHRLGATVGPQWVNISAALIRSRTALAAIEAAMKEEGE